ncbi:acyl-CoA dehydrogenase family protein [Solwaraspora sp. WMMD406]|uniref:acyl-CoA dehydrogenase family protein n=1 Tax=Solwaraspora sp. WMMD406 TaxID=3016095 RepID=UPI0024168D84|nr:acyl-CoA dehydrogenase family protein [Solwaraspora sp. WMMD406]MDG4766905.1 acyl-CoA dehydrogenase family protein [Solwaraspora sp. WMMD406]
MTVVHAPPHDDLVEKAADLVPLLRKHAAWGEENRRLHDETIEAMTAAGIFKMRVPTRYGGYESDSRTIVEVATQLGRGDGAAAWTASVYWIPSWMVGMFPDETQDEVFGTPDVRVCGTLSPTGMAAPADGGVVVNGRWGFISGAWHSQWQEIIAMSPTPDGGMQPVLALVPMSDLQIVDDWHTSGVRGSGSVTTVATDVFVPQHRVLPLGALMMQQSASVANADSAMYKVPLVGAANVASAGVMVGMAKGAMEAFMERLPDRKITYTMYDSQREAPVTHLQVGEATLKIDAAEFHALRVARRVDERTATGEPWSMLDRASSRADVGAACRLSKEAVDLLNQASGGSSIYSDVPIQRIARDIHVISTHGLIYPATNTELLGRVLCGLEPNTLFI